MKKSVLKNNIIRRLSFISPSLDPEELNHRTGVGEKRLRTPSVSAPLTDPPNDLNLNNSEPLETKPIGSIHFQPLVAVGFQTTQKSSQRLLSSRNRVPNQLVHQMYPGVTETSWTELDEDDKTEEDSQTLTSELSLNFSRAKAQSAPVAVAHDNSHSSCDNQGVTEQCILTEGLGARVGLQYPPPSSFSLALSLSKERAESSETEGWLERPQNINDITQNMKKVVNEQTINLRSIIHQLHFDQLHLINALQFTSLLQPHMEQLQQTHQLLERLLGQLQVSVQSLDRGGALSRSERDQDDPSDIIEEPRIELIQPATVIFGVEPHLIRLSVCNELAFWGCKDIKVRMTVKKGSTGEHQQGVVFPCSLEYRAVTFAPQWQQLSASSGDEFTVSIVYSPHYSHNTNHLETNSVSLKMIESSFPADSPVLSQLPASPSAAVPPLSIQQSHVGNLREIPISSLGDSTPSSQLQQNATLALSHSKQNLVKVNQFPPSISAQQQDHVGSVVDHRTTVEMSSTTPPQPPPPPPPPPPPFHTLARETDQNSSQQQHQQQQQWQQQRHHQRPPVQEPIYQQPQLQNNDPGSGLQPLLDQQKPHDQQSQHTLRNPTRQQLQKKPGPEQRGPSRKRKSQQPSLQTPNVEFLEREVRNRLPSSVYIIPKEHLEFQGSGSMSEGSFSLVYRAAWTGRGRPFPEEVCVKFIKYNAETYQSAVNAFIQEVLTQMELSQHSTCLLELYGVTFAPMLGVPSPPGYPTFGIVSPAKDGSLLNYILDQQRMDRDTMPLPKLLDFATNIAQGLEVMHRNGYVHRDIAARNILIERKPSGRFNAFICDFGHARKEFCADNEHLATKWSDPYRNDRPYTAKSDCWSFGVVLWEMMEGKYEPYEDISLEKIHKKLQKGYRLKVPVECPKLLKDLVLSCWHPDHRRRPASIQICEQLRSLRDACLTPRPDRKLVVFQYTYVENEESGCSLESNSGLHRYSLFSESENEMIQKLDQIVRQAVIPAVDLRFTSLQPIPSQEGWLYSPVDWYRDPDCPPRKGVLRVLTNSDGPLSQEQISHFNEQILFALQLTQHRNSLQQVYGVTTRKITDGGFVALGVVTPFLSYLLHDFLRTKKRIPLSTVIDISISVGLGLVTLHDRGFVHNRIDIDHIYVDSRYKFKRFLFEEKWTALIHTINHLEKRSDLESKSQNIFALGLIMYKMLTGKIEEPSHSLAEDRSDSAGLSPQISAAIPRELSELVSACLHTAVDRRPTAPSLVNALYSIRGKERQVNQVFIATQPGFNTEIRPQESEKQLAF